jgi:phosphohistidine phosphatase
LATLLLLVRHGPAEVRDPISWPDDMLRPLTKDGRRCTRDVARALERLKICPQLIATSPAVRSRATADILMEELEPQRPLAVWPELGPDEAPEPVLDRVGRLGGGRGPVVVVGHEPQLGEMVGVSIMHDAISVARLAKAGAALIHFPSKVAPGAGRIEWLLTRSQLVRLS